MLGEHNITYRPRTSVKGQVLVDFHTEMPDENPPATPVVETQKKLWTLFTDGSSCVDGSEKSIKEKEVKTVVEENGPTWMTQIMEYLKEGTLPSDRKEARKLRIKARQYELLEGILYRRSFLTSWLRCVGTLQAEYVNIEIHKGSCSMHVGPRSVVAKDIQLGYYWPMMHRDARDMIRPWPFYKWGIDIADPFPEGPGEIVSDNGKQFSDNPFKDWCDKLNITQRFASVKHPQSNGLAERSNQSLEEGIKARLGEENKNWVEELPHVLWAHRIMIKSSHGDTPFSLTYGAEAVIAAEIGMPMYRTAAVDVVYNDEELRLNLDLLEGRHERTAIREAKAKLKMTKYYNAMVRVVTFRPGDFVYRSNDASQAVQGGKLGPKWEGTLRELDLSNLGEAPSSDVSVCVAASVNRIARPCEATVGTDTGTLSDLA
nr:reverse transcriptase domain-containing protein [Tanacetum cinerariifolium]